MTRGLRGRLAVIALFTTGVALLAVLLLSGPALEGRALDQMRDVLLAEARLTARLIEPSLLASVSTYELDRIVDEIARDAATRVTIVAPDGRVRGDSSLSGDLLERAENHGRRPEVELALRGLDGVASRRSATLDEDLLYVAAPIRVAGRVVGVARVARPIVAVREQARDLRRGVVTALALAFVLAAVLSAALSAPLARQLRDIMGGARQFASGNLGVRIAVARDDELGELATILNNSAAQLQERLAETARDRARTAAILAAMEDGLLAVDHAGCVLVANDTLRRQLHLQGEVVGRHYLETVRQREVGEVIEEVLRTGARRELETELRHPRRSSVLTAVPFPDTGDSPHGAVLTFRDVTETRRLEHVRRDFVANASHELRTPLTSIRGFVEALEDGALDDPARAPRFLGKIRTHADRMAALVEDLLELSRLESGARPPQWEQVAPAEIAADVVVSFGERAAGKGIRLSHVDRGATRVRSDPGRLRQILDNLVDNAVKYTPEGGHVEVLTQVASAGGVRVEVRDDGPGIPAEHQRRIFERFYRVDKGRSRELGGTGLGLSIVKHLAEGMGARVSVVSTPDKGSCFAVELPREPEAAARSASIGRWAD